MHDVRLFFCKTFHVSFNLLEHVGAGA